jgi:hypothetical protein
MRSLLVMLIVAAFGCNADSYEAKAKIIERKVLADSQLLIRYSFLAAGKTITDSVQMQNKIIPDTLTVVYSSSHPEKNTLKFP